jgi:hypothetical protein
MTRKPMPDWPKHIEAHRGPKGGAMYCEPGYPGQVYHRYIREDVVADMAANAHISHDFHREVSTD